MQEQITTNPRMKALYVQKFPLL